MNDESLSERIAKLSPAKRSLLELRLRERNGSSSAEPSIPRRETHDAAPLSFAQQRLWFLNQLEPDSPAYNEPRAIRLTGALDVNALRWALNQIIERHEVLRTTFEAVDGIPRQRVAERWDSNFSIVDLRTWPGATKESEVHRLVVEFSRRPFDLSRDLMLRALLLRVDNHEHVLSLVTHHIASDGWSAGILAQELAGLYGAFISGVPSTLPELPIQYSDYAAWQRDWLQGDVLDTQIGYWKKQLNGVLPLQLLTRSRPSVQTHRGARQSAILSDSLSDALRALSRREGVTLFMTLLAAFQTLLLRHTTQDDVAVGSPIAGRIRAETENLIGFFVNTLVLRTDLSGNPTFREVLQRVREVALGAYAHQDVPFEKLVEELNPDRNLSTSPLFQIMFALQNVPRWDIQLPGLSAAPFETESGIAKFDLFIAIIEQNRQLTVRAIYNSDLFAASTIARILGHFEILLESIAADLEQRISDLPILSQSEKHQLLVKWNDTKKDYPRSKSIHELFEEQVERSPDSIAVVCENEQLTYRELNRRGNQLARYLRRLGVAAETLVAVCMGRSLELIVGLLGILKAGGTYVPLDPEYPRDRVAFMLHDTRALVLLTQQRLIECGESTNDNRASLSQILDSRTSVVCLDRDWRMIAQETGENLKSEVTAENLAYVLYTSGSTGIPKGVEVPHRGVVRLLLGVDYAELGSSQTFLHLAPASFDASTFEIWGALLHGGKCVLLPGCVPTPTELAKALHHNGVTTLWLTSSLFNAVIDESAQALSSVRQLLIGGEALSVPHVRRALALLPGTTIINGYGPTESTTFTCCYRIPRDLDENVSSIPIGRPIGNTQAFILDANLTPVPIGVTGELYIGGDGLARGYLNNPGLTAEKFIPNPFSDLPGSRLYRTGDLARYLPDGNIEFLGRADHQVKIRGYRIELGEIESVLRRHHGINDAVVVVREDALGDKHLVAYATRHELSTVMAGELRSFLHQMLPEYMVPSAFVFLDALPVMVNGKIDRRALSLSNAIATDSKKSFVAPRDHLERRLSEIYATLLGVGSVSVQDNFFDLGGHSLLGMRLMSQIEKVFGKSFPIATLFQAPTIERLAMRLRETATESRWSSLVPIQTAGSKVPFFWVHGECSDAFLPKYLGPDQPVYGFRHQGEDGYPALNTRVEDIAAQYLHEMRDIQGNGPYYLGGYCFGGIVAFEMAYQLKRRGEEVALLVLLDPSNVRNGQSSSFFAGQTDALSRSASLRTASQGHLRYLEHLKSKNKFTYVINRGPGKIKEITSSALAPVRIKIKRIMYKGCLQLGYRIPPSLRSPYILDVYMSALRNYAPKAFYGKVVIFEGDGHADRAKQWNQLALGDLSLHKVSGNHSDILQEPHVQVWAEKLKSYLQEHKDVCTSAS